MTRELQQDGKYDPSNDFSGYDVGGDPNLYLTDPLKPSLTSEPHKPVSQNLSPGRGKPNSYEDSGSVIRNPRQTGELPSRASNSAFVDFRGNVNLAGRGYSNLAPALIVSAAQQVVEEGYVDSGHLEVHVLRSAIKTGGVTDAQVYSSVIAEVQGMGDEKLAQTFLSRTLPRVLLFSSLLTRDNHPGSAKQALISLARQVKQGRVDISTFLCPPYTYQLRRDGKLRHASGEIQLTAGEGVWTASRAFRAMFEDLIKLGVQVNISYLTYSGEKDVKHLFEMGQDVLDHYRDNTHELLARLRTGFADMNSKGQQVFKGSGIGFRSISLEGTLVPDLIRLEGDFETNFGSTIMGAKMVDGDREIEGWLKRNLGVGEGWLLFFLDEEIQYAKKQGLPLDYGLVKSALKEGLLYWAMQEYIHKQDSVIIGCETTTNYMVGSLRHCPRRIGVIMGRPWDSAFGIRQPFNIPS